MEGEGFGDASDKPSAWSPVSSWEMGFLNSSDWQAKWIGMGEISSLIPQEQNLHPISEKLFEIGDKIVSARIRVCGLGFYELMLNGQKNWRSSTCSRSDKL